LKSIAIIPARSGSKGLKDKNIMELNGKPLLAYSIEAAKESKLFDVIHVSTDSEKYAEIARQFGADVPFLRDAEFSTDTSSTWDAVLNVLDKYEKKGKRFDIVVLLQPTSPLRNSDDIIGAWEFFNKKKANMVSSVCEMEHSPLWSNTLPEDLSMENFEDEKIAYLPRQSLPKYYRENGAIYIVRTEHLRTENNIYKNGGYAYVMDGRHSIDIDSELDFLIASVMMEKG
jgi:CMP-N,N'-diacetyllegionaminic acid synthase